MRYASTLFALLIGLTFNAQTIPNSNFESWDFNGWNYSPSEWTTNNTQLTQDTFQDTLTCEGNFAMEVRPTIVSLGSEGVASVVIPMTEIPASLDFKVKYWRTTTAFLSVEIVYYNGTDYIENDMWYADDTLSDWLQVSLPLSQIEPIMTHAELRVGAFVGDFAPGDGAISVDEMSFGTINSTPTFDKVRGLNIYPNPSSGIVEFDSHEVDIFAAELAVYDYSGRLVESTRMSRQVDFSHLQKGIYLLQVSLNDGKIIQDQLVIE